MKKNIFLSLSTIITMGAVFGSALSLASNNDLKYINQNNINSNLRNNAKATSETILTSDIVNKLGWNMKTTITLSDWANSAPNVTTISGLAFYNNNVLVLIEFPASILSIGASSFGHNTSLRSVLFEQNSNLSTIGSGAFANSAIESINIPSSVQIIDSFAFEKTSLLKKITFSPISNLLRIEVSAFKDSAIESINLPDKNISVGDNAFQNTTSLVNITAKYSLKLNSEVSKYGFSQNQWDSINWIYSPTNNTIITFDVLKSINWDKKSIITLKDWSTMAPMATKIEDGFTNHKFLERIEIPKSVLTIDSNSFSDNTKLLSIKMPMHFKSETPNFGLSSIQWNNIEWIMPATIMYEGSLELSGVADIAPCKFDERYIKQLVIGELLRYAPSNLTESNVILENLNLNNLTGEINVFVSLNKYYDENLEEQTENFTPVYLNLLGFKKIIPSSIIEQEYIIEEVSNLKPDDYTDKEIVDFLKSKVTGDIPENFDIMIVEQKITNNGKIIIKAEMINYFNSDGLFNAESSSISTFILSGFGVVKSYATLLIAILSIGSILLIATGFVIYKITESEKNKKSKEIIVWE